MNPDERNERLEYHTKQMEIGIDLERRIIMMDSDIDITSPNTLKSKINLICDVTQDRITPITLDICCYGGQVEGLFGCVDIIKSSKPLINTRAIGTAMSAAALLLMVGTGERVMGKHTSLMLHELHSALQDGMGKLDSDVKYLKGRTAEALILLETHSKKSRQFWRKNMQKNIYLTSEQCLAMGLIDRIGLENNE